MKFENAGSQAASIVIDSMTYVLVRMLCKHARHPKMMGTGESKTLVGRAHSLPPPGNRK
jgi:hypothetical protein